MTRRRKRNPGWFRKGKDHRRRKGFAKDECQRGYQAALEKCQAIGWHAYAWFYYRIRGWYRRKKREQAKPPPAPLADPPPWPFEPPF